MQGQRSMGKNTRSFAGVSAVLLFGLPLAILAIAIGSGEMLPCCAHVPLCHLPCEFDGCLCATGYLQQLGGNYGF